MMDGSQKRRVCQLIAGLVVVDDDLDPAEDAFIDKMLAKFGLPQSDREVIFPIIDAEEASNSILTLPAEVRTEALDLLIQAAAADGQIVEEEQDYLNKVAQAIGVSQAELDSKTAAQLAAG